jgi:hypothetical protein
VQDKAVEILADQPHGLRFLELAELVIKGLPEYNPNSVKTVLAKLADDRSDCVCKPARGLYMHAKNYGEASTKPVEAQLANIIVGMLPKRMRQAEQLEEPKEAMHRIRMTCCGLAPVDTDTDNIATTVRAYADTLEEQLGGRVESSDIQVEELRNYKVTFNMQED